MDECSVIESHRATRLYWDELIDGPKCVFVVGLVVENSGKLVLIVGPFHVIKLKKNNAISEIPNKNKVISVKKQGK